MAAVRCTSAFIVISESDVSRGRDDASLALSAEISLLKISPTTFFFPGRYSIV